MNIENINMGSYNLHLISTKSFKTISVEIDFRRLEKKEDTTIRNLLKMVLINSNMDYKSEKELIIASEELYDIKISSILSRIGNYSNLGFRAKFLDEKYTTKGMNEESIKFLLDLIFKPKVINNSFIDIEPLKEKLRKSIDLLSDNKLKYTILKLFETTKDMPYSYSTIGNVNDLDKINGKSLYRYYKDVLDKDIIDIYVVGDINKEEIKRVFKDYFKIYTFKKDSSGFIVRELRPRKRIVKYHEEAMANQTQITFLCSLHNLTRLERNYVIKVYSYILGGSSNSILFQNIREKNSLAYYVNADVKPYDNIMVIYSGIDNENIDKVIKMVKTSLSNIEKGKFTSNDLGAAITTMVNSVSASLDSPFGMINNATSEVLINSDNIDKRIETYKRITKEDIINVSKKVKLHTIYTLQPGGKN